LLEQAFVGGLFVSSTHRNRRLRLVAVRGKLELLVLGEIDRQKLDNRSKHVYTCYMEDRSLNPKLTDLSRIPATCMGMHVRRASRILTQVYDDALRPVGLVSNQFTLLVAIHLNESTPITQLAQGLFTDQTTLTRNLKLLEQRGLVAIEPGEDRRIKLVSLTVAGREALTQALPLWEQAQSKVMAHFSPEQWEMLLSLLSDVKTVS
jgi:DNA-binding MarR family transcriptional regulator